MTQHLETTRDVPRLIQAIGLWILVGVLVLTPASMFLVRRFVEPTIEVEGWIAYETWPQNVRILALGIVIGFVAGVVILVGTALRLTKSRPG